MIKVPKKLQTEILAGFTTFFTMIYIVVVNPSLLSMEGTGIPFQGALTSTVLLCFLMTFLMGVYAKVPFAVAPGMGINAFLIFNVILGNHVPWQTALGAVFWSGIFFLVISFTPLLSMIANAIPHSLRIGAAVGIGIFLTFLGLKNAGFIAADPVTFVKLGALDRKSVLSFLGLLVIIVLLKRKNPFAFLAGISFVTFFSWALGLIHLPQKVISQPNFSELFLKLDPKSALQWALVPTMISIFFTTLFDSISTFVGVSQATGLLDSKGEPKNLRQGLVVGAWSAITSSIVGTTPGIAYIESSAGIEAGGRTGVTSIVTALCFLPCLFIAPLISMVPPYATAPVLILVGALMFRSIQDLPTDSLEELVPAFLTLVLIPLTFSITQGLLWGFISHVGLYFLTGRRKDLHPILVLLALIAVGLLTFEHGIRSEI